MCFGTRRRKRALRGRAPVHRRTLFLWLAIAAVPALASEASAQRPGGSPPSPEQTTAANITLVYDREVFVYRGADRRDPFRPLTNENEMGPLFESLTLSGIIYSTGRGNSVALLSDGSGRVHRVRAGDVIGNSTVVEIGPLRVVMAVENFGNIRQEMLELQRNRGANR